MNISQFEVSELYLQWYPACILTSFLVRLQEYLNGPEPSSANPRATSPTLPSVSVKTHCLKERLHGFLSPTLLKDGSSPDNTSSPCDRESDGALNAALISAFLSHSQGTAGSEKPDISQPIRFSSSFDFYKKEKKKFASAFCSLCVMRRFACI